MSDELDDLDPDFEEDEEEDGDEDAFRQFWVSGDEDPII